MKEISEAEYLALTGNPSAEAQITAAGLTEGNIVAGKLVVPVGGTQLVNNSSTTPIVTQINTTNNTPGQTLITQSASVNRIASVSEIQYDELGNPISSTGPTTGTPITVPPVIPVVKNNTITTSTVAPVVATPAKSEVDTAPAATNFGASVQTFDDGTTLQTFDDGSVLATATDGSITSSPALTVDYTVNAQDAARAGLTADQLALLGGADATDPYIRARLDLPPLSEVQTLSGAIGNVNFGNIGNVVTTAITDIKVAAGNVGNAISDFFSSSTPNTVPTSSVTTSPETTNAGASIQTFDDGSKIQTFDDGSVLITDSEGGISSKPAPTEAGATTQIFDDGSVLTTSADGTVTSTPAPAASSVDTTPAPTNYGASIQTFDDGTTIQTFDDGSVLATGTDGSITSSPAPTEIGTTTQVFDDGSVLTTNADGSVSATNAVEGTNVATSADDVQAKAREGLTAAQLESLGGADATDPYIRARLDLPPLTTQPNLVDALTPTPDPVPVSEVFTTPADTNVGTTTQTFDDGTTLQTFDDGSVLATATDGSVTSAPAPVDSTVDPEASLAPGETIVPVDQIDTAPADTNFGTTTQTFDDGTTIQTFDDGSVLVTGTDGGLNATDAPVDNTQGYGIGDQGNVTADNIAQDPGSYTADELNAIADAQGVAGEEGNITSDSLAKDPGSYTAAELDAIADAQGVSAGDGPIDPTNTGIGTSADSAAAGANIQGLVQGAQQQQTIADQRKQINNGDWRVRLRLAPQSKYLYNASNPGILKPLQVTDGIIFPYTPAISTNYRATYSPYELTHSNYKGYFYQSSYVDAIQLTANFTAQDTNDANYLLAVIHFLRSATKMFYGQDTERGSPPPVVYLSGFGDYQFREHSCLISNFAYNLPADVDYIRAGSPNNVGLNLTSIRDRQSVATNSIFGSINRLAAAFLTKGAVTNPPAPPTLGLNRPTYVPTKMEIQLTLLPIQSRNQVSNQFSLKGFANGDLLKGGFW
jgi:hypothetical protein